MITQDERKRYDRQLNLPGFGEIAQEKLKHSSVIVIGAGGLGCPILQYLAAAGVGTIGIVDDDRIDVSNLQRQVLFTTAEVGAHKAVVAADKIKALNPTVETKVHCCRLTRENALDILNSYDLVIDGSDNFATRYLVSDACSLLRKTLVFGAVFRFEGQVAVFDHGENTPGYRDAFPETEKSTALNCNEAGVLGVLPGMIGTIMACEALKVMSGMGGSFLHKLLLLDSRDMNFQTMLISVRKETQTLLPRTAEEFRARTSKDAVCENRIRTISCEMLEQKLRSKEKVMLIDVRPKDEWPASGLPCTTIELGEIETADLSFADGREIILFCKGGKRSADAYNKIVDRTGIERTYSLDGGIVAWHKYKHKNEVV